MAGRDFTDLICIKNVTGSNKVKGSTDKVKGSTDKVKGSTE